MTPIEARDYIIRHCNPDYPLGKTEWETAINMAIHALTKQVPKPLTEELDITDRPIKVCGNCGDVFTGFGDYCKWCGQRIER